MPTVPSACVPVSSFDDEGRVGLPIRVSEVISDYGHSSPTPDPELDDVVLVQTASAVSTVRNAFGSFEQCIRQSLLQTSSNQPPAHINTRPMSDGRSNKPRLNLSDIQLHSPSSIVGTPFDVSPRFEYPFPSEGSLSSDNLFFSPSATNSLMSPLSFYESLSSISSAPSLPLATVPRAREPRPHPSTHPKLQHRDPPVPPSLAAKKRWSTGPPQTHGRPRGASAGTDSELVERPKLERMISTERKSLEWRRDSGTFVDEPESLESPSKGQQSPGERRRATLHRSMSDMTVVQQVPSTSMLDAIDALGKAALSTPGLTFTHDESPLGSTALAYETTETRGSSSAGLEPPSAQLGPSSITTSNDIEAHQDALSNKTQAVAAGS